MSLILCVAKTHCYFSKLTLPIYLTLIILQLLVTHPQFFFDASSSGLRTDNLYLQSLFCVSSLNQQSTRRGYHTVYKEPCFLFPIDVDP